MEQQTFNVTGMSCAACSARVEKEVAALPGVAQVQVNLLTRSMRVQYDTTQLTPASIIAAVESAGYGASQAGTGNPPPQQETLLKSRFLTSLLFLLPLVLLHHTLSSPLSLLLQSLLLLPILWQNRVFFISGAKAIRNGAPNMDTLVSLGAGASILYTAVDAALLQNGGNYLESAGMILTLITLGKWIESHATAHTGDALSKLRRLLPSTACIRRQGKTLQIPAEDVQTGDTLIIAEGAQIPVDAIVTDGRSSIDESTLTGESMPVLKEAGSPIFAGTINGNGSLIATATRTRAESTLSNIIDLVGEASAAKAPMARLADTISGMFVPVVVGIALLTALLWLLQGASLSFAIGCAIAVLVISCPCALGLATPVAIMAGAGKGAENGILFRDAAAMEHARRASVILLDKTGTLTAGFPIVTGIQPAQGVTKDKLLQLAASLEQNSSHPLAQAIRNATSVYTPEPCTSLQYHPGRGITAQVQGAYCMAGNERLLQENGITLPPCDHGSMTPLHFVCRRNYMGSIIVSDPLKPDSAAAVAAMQEAGLRVIMMSGDKQEAVQAVARQTHIREYEAAVLPQDKEEKVRQLQAEGHCVAMIGDGINDAPALTRADIGIAIGAGTDVAINSAGIILVRNELSDAVAALQLSRAVIRIIRQNLFWAFFYNVLAIPLAAGLYYPLLGWQLSPGVAAAAMSLSSLFVVCNALRLQHFQPHIPTTTHMNTLTISVQGMMCPHCERHVTQALTSLPGITEVKADHKSSTVTLSSTGETDEAGIAAAVRQAGYDYKGIC